MDGRFLGGCSAALQRKPAIHNESSSLTLAPFAVDPRFDPFPLPDPAR